MGAHTSRGPAFFVSAARTLTSVGGRKHCGRSRRLSPAEPMHDRAREPGAFIGRKHRDRADGRADEDEESHAMLLWVEAGCEAGAGVELAHSATE
jgi:hypothetical protein